MPVTPLRVRPVTAQPLRRPVTEQQRPASERQRPSAERQRSSAERQRSSAERQRSSAERQRPATREAHQPPAREARQRPERAVRRVVAQRRTTVSHRGMVRKTVRRTVERPLRATRGGMNAVIAYARSQVGKRYVHGGEGSRGGFDCSGLTRQAYARAGMRLPHSSGAQASRARRVPRGQARPGDLVIGPGHVGIYMGRGMMIDAGNRRTGVSYRKVYRGLRVARIPGS
ncbi:C40 family peptidase [Actinoplanes awajinensis]|uniref:C40 family peptidase n=1 Tax=Actinoplanes awajinensis TaxID=135946 RepID=UPI001E4151FE|nr:NlpC/P60 family protein [Actinoplanes awajinensis]